MDRTSIPPELWRSSLFARVYTDANASTRKRYLPLIIGMVLWLLFWVWFFGSHAAVILELDALTYVILASIWMLISPLLVAQAERRLGILIRALDDAPLRDGWKIDGIVDALQAANSRYWSIVVPFTLIFPMGFVLAQPFMETTLGLEPLSPTFLMLGLFCMTLTGFASGNGVWGAYKVLKLFRSVARSSNPSWYPMRYNQIDGYEELSRFALTTALTFSCGSLFAPIVILVLQNSTGMANILSAMGLMILLFGAAALFIIPVYHLAELAEDAREKHLELIAAEIESHLRDMRLMELCEDTTPSERRSLLSLEELCSLRILLTTVPTLGRPIVFLRRVSLLIFLPFVIGVAPPLLINLMS